jgi:hypothetical protein
MDALPLREILLTIHLLAVIVWIGFGFCELWLGRLFLQSEGQPVEATLIRFIYQCDLAVFIATLTAFAAGVTMALTLGWGFFTTLWLGAKQAIMFAVLGEVVLILPRALRLGPLISALPAGPGPATPDIRATYRWLEPWYLLMRLAALAAVALAVWRPA